jgi:hypothetical protein
MIDLEVIGNYIFLEYATCNQVLTREKKDSYALIIINETPLDNTR